MDGAAVAGLPEAIRDSAFPIAADLFLAALTPGRARRRADAGEPLVRAERRHGRQRAAGKHAGYCGWGAVWTAPQRDCLRLRAVVAGQSGGLVSGPDRNARVVEHQAGGVIGEPALEVKGWSGVVVALACALVGCAQVGLLKPVYG